MATTFFQGFDSQSIGTENGTLAGTASFSTAQVRGGTASLRCNPGAGSSGYFQFTTTPAAGYFHFGLYIVTMPTATRKITGIGAASEANIRLTSSGTLLVYTENTLIATGTITLTTGQWYWIGYKTAASTAEAIIQVDGVNDGGPITASGMVAPLGIGCQGTTTSATDMYFDDLIIDGAGFIASSKVALLVPTADSAVGTGWTLGSGGTSNLWDALDNEPPTAVADAGTTAQIRNAASAANSNYDATMTTYTAAGVASGDTTLAVRPIISTAAPVATSAKQGTVGVVSNPAIANIALGAGGSAGAFWSGVTAAAFPTGWKTSFGTLTTSPSVTVGTAPVMRITQVTASTRIAMVAFMGIYVAWTPAAAAADVVPAGRIPQYVQHLAH
jgi:hypothetical protein